MIALLDVDPDLGIMGSLFLLSEEDDPFNAPAPEYVREQVMTAARLQADRGRGTFVLCLT